MKKAKRNGFRDKILRLCIIMAVNALVVSLVGAFFLIRYLDETLTTLSDAQREVVSGRVEEIMSENFKKTALTANRLARIDIEGSAEMIEDDLAFIANEVKEIYLHPERYDEYEIEPPKAENNGKLALQILYADDNVKNDKECTAFARRLVHLASDMEHMLVKHDTFVSDCFIVLPDGVTLAMDRSSASKFDENGDVRFYDPRVRPWYIETLKKKGFCYNEIDTGYYDGLPKIAFAWPVYDEDKLIAVIHGSARLDDLKKYIDQIVSISAGNDSFSIFIDNKGTVTLSSKESGELSLDNGEALSLDAIEDAGLKTLIEKVMGQDYGYEKAEIEGRKYIVTYSKVINDGWMYINFLSEEEATRVKELLLNDVEENFESNKRVMHLCITVALVLAVIMIVIIVMITIIGSTALSKKIVRPVQTMTDRIREMDVENFEFKMEDVYRSVDDIEVLAKAFSRLSEKIHDYIDEIVEFTAKEEKEKTELEVARRIQYGMLPMNFPIFPDKEEFELFASMDPAKMIGGDFYDAFLIDEDHLCMVVGDVSGKGIPAALFMAKAMTIIKNCARPGEGPSEILKNANAALNYGNNEMMFVTVWLAVLNISTGLLTEANAGHESPVIRRNGEGYELIGQDHGIVLGALPGQEYKEDSFVMDKGDILFAYTDGLIESVNSEGKRMGTDKMLDILNSFDDESTERLIDHMKDKVNEFADGAEQFDDLTMLAVRYV